jgi:hypothetical protein
VVTAAERAAPAWIFPSGNTSAREVVNGRTVDTGYAETLFLFNPSQTNDVPLDLSVIDSSGRVLHQLSMTLSQGQTLALNMNQLGLPPGHHATIVRSGNGTRFIAEQTVTFNGGRNAYTGPGVAAG